ncbi:LamG domain-containing protein [Paraglaciecola aquimarina]|uniref:LamG domain-containing protein n=1 Tax=Paraglaciecola algarum TaxID=3050085 RepID=A0ABS9D396_9ALTE|nr:LamG domain-containing protein [Paraglaciecola sp. G1-23]MCF2947361.1 LamG domain-containing protein [Paraglaciecola sp. G1-23]
MRLVNTTCQILSVLILLPISFVSVAAQCGLIFPDGASTHSANGTIYFGYNSRLTGSEDNLLATTSIGKNGGSNLSTCSNADCVATGTASQAAPNISFQATNSTDDITLRYQGAVVVGTGRYRGNEFDDINPSSASEANITFSNTHSQYFVDRLVLGFKNTLYLQAGSTYWFNQLSMGSQANIVVQGTGTAFIYVNQSLSFPSPGLINSPSINNSGDASKLVLYAFSEVNFNNNSTFTGSLYVKGDLTLGSSSYAFGAVSAANIDLGTESTITYQSSEVDDTDYGALCNNTPPVELIAHYLFNNGTGQSISDASGYGRNGTLGGSAAVNDQDPSWQCEASGYYLDFDKSKNQRLTTSAFTPPQKGVVAFWMKIPSVPNSLNRIFGFGDGYEIRFDSGGVMYIDINKTGSNNSIRTSGAFTTTNTWTHFAFTTNVSTGDWAVYIDGVLDNSGNEVLSAQPSNALTIGGSTWQASSNSLNGSLDDFRIYSGLLTGSEIQALAANPPQECVSVHHYEISHPNQALTCSSASIEIKACENAACTQLSSAFVSLDFQANNTTYISNTIIGSTNFAYTNTTAETVTLSIANANEAPTHPITCNGSSASGACDLTFVDAGFEFFGATINDVFPDQVAADNFVNANLRAVRNNAGVCEPLLVGFKDITLSYECDTPNTCLTPFSNIPITNDTGKNSGTVNLKFDSSGVANLDTLNYPDAGQIILSAEAEIDGATFSTTGEETIVVYPSYLQLSVDETELIYGGTGEQNNYIAGESFTFIIGAYGTNNQLLPNYETIDSGSDPELKVTRISPANSGQNGNFKYSNIGTATATTSATYTNAAGLSFNGGKHSYSNAYYDEVGRIELNAQDNNYFGHVISSNGSLLIGDFYPAYYKVYASNTPTLNKTCNTFSYIGQEMTFATDPELTLTAYNALDSVTQNYSDNYWNYAPNKTTLETYLNFADSSSYALTGTASVIGLGDAPLIENNTNYNGSGTIAITNSSFKYDKVDTNNNTYDLSTPFEASMNLRFASDFFMSTFTDQSSTQHTICHQNTYAEKACLGLSIEDVTGTQMRYGRFVLDSNYGPETEGLTVPIKTEFYNANSLWQINNEDSCTSIEFSQNANELVLEGDAGVLAAVNEITSIGLLTAGVSPDPGNLFFNAPNIMGEIVLKLNPLLPDPNTEPYAWPSYLNYDWNGDGVICNLGSCPDSINDTDSDPQLTDYPSATMSFGLFRGNDRIIQWREVFN